MTTRKLFAIVGLLVTAVALMALTTIGYHDLSIYSSAPANPGSGYDRLYVTSAGLLCKTSSGASCLVTSSATAGGVNAQTTSYTAVSGDSGKLISFNCSSACTLTLPGTPPSSTWWILTESTGAGTLTVSRNSLNIDGAATNLTLTQNQGVEISTDASNYFTERGMASGSGTFASLTTTGTSGAATLLSGVLNVPVYSSGGGSTTHAIGMSFGASGGTPLTVGQTAYVTIPFACSIAAWSMTVDTGTATTDIWKIAAAPIDWALKSGTVTTLGTAVTWSSGTTFPPDAAGRHITINSVLYTIASVTSSTVLVLTSTAGTQASPVAYSSPGNQIPTVTNSITASALPAIATATANGSNALTGWTTAVTKNDIFGFNIQAVAGATTVLSIVLECN